MKSMRHIRLRELREEKGNTIEETAAIAGISVEEYLFFEKEGNYELDAEGFCALADYYDVTLDYIVGRTDIRNYWKDIPEEVRIVIQRNQFGENYEILVDK